MTMGYAEDCYEAVEARRKADSVEYDLNALRRDHHRLRCDYDEVIDKLRAEIRELWAVLKDTRNDVGP
jgi:hypothetical protein